MDKIIESDPWEPVPKLMNQLHLLVAQGLHKGVLNNPTDNIKNIQTALNDAYSAGRASAIKG